jgi:NADH:ubiquinone oxidoreductase subunit K
MLSALASSLVYPCGALALAAEAAGSGVVDPAALSSSPGLQHYLLVGALTFAIGIVVILVRRSAIAILMGLELLLNSVVLNFVAFSRLSPPGRIDGQVFGVFIIVIAAAEAALALAITLNIFSNLNTVEVDEARSLKG